MKLLSTISTLLLCLLLYACTEEGTFTSSPSAKLEFSQDTVAFDTLISTIGSATKTMTVYNSNKDGLRISQVGLGKGASSPFRVNVDGQNLYAGIGEDFEVRGKDSLMVRIEVTPPRVNSKEILAFED